MMALRQVASVLALPVTAAVLVPIWIARRRGISASAPGHPSEFFLAFLGIALGVAGLTLFIWSLYHFWTAGHGTLAPWDPPRVFVAEGPYRFVRNPMISGVLF